MSQTIFSFAIGLGTKNNKGEWLEAFFPAPLFKPEAAAIKAAAELIGYTSGNQSIEITSAQLEGFSAALEAAGLTEQAQIAKSLEGSQQSIVVCILESDSAPQTTAETYLKLHLISHRFCKPHSIDLSGMFPLLPNVAWTSEGAIDLNELPARQLAARVRGEVLEVSSVDKFPKMTNYVVPTGVRIAHTARVRLGAYVGEGTTIMHEGFVNFNAGTEGTSMVEGRISAGVMVGKGSDLGGGCSTMGTLSGGNSVIISVGEGCLLGANAGLGIPLGDRCTIEAGLYVTGGSKVVMLDDAGKEVAKVKASELAGKNDLLFRRNSLSGALECKTNRSAIELNEELHAHN